VPHGTLAGVRGPLLVLTWIAATTLATGLAWAGVRSVVDNVAAPLPVPVATTGQAGPSERPPAREASPEPTPNTSEQASEPGSEPRSEPPPERSEPAQPQETVRTFELSGGTATVRFSPAGVEVLSAVPKAGFSADLGPEDGGMRVEFESDDHRSRLDVWWNGEPRHETDEQESGGGGHGEDGGGEDGGDDHDGDD
jgi:hypothetical protein